MKNLMSLLLTLFFFLTVSTYGQFVSFVEDYGTSAHSIAIGQIEGFDYSASAIFENPAFMSTDSVSTFYRNFPESDTSYYNFAMSKRFKNITYGIGISRHAVSDLTYTGENDSEQFYVIDTFNTSESVYYAGVSKQSKNFAIGASLSYYSQDLYSSVGSGFDIDLGLYKRMTFADVSLVAKRLLVQEFSYSNGYGSLELPEEVSLALKRDFENITVYTQFKSVLGHSLKSYGVSYHPPIFGDFLEVQGSVRSILVLEDVRSLSTLGIQLYVGGIRINAAFEKSDYVPSDNQFYISSHLMF